MSRGLLELILTLEQIFIIIFHIRPVVVPRREGRRFILQTHLTGERREGGREGGEREGGKRERGRREGEDGRREGGRRGKRVEGERKRGGRKEGVKDIEGEI